MSQPSYDATDRPHHPRCPISLDGVCLCADLDSDDYDAEMDRRIDAERDK